MTASRMEIEAKYSVPDAAAFERLLALESLGDYRLEPRGTQDILDRYLDTAARDLLRGRYACRIREPAAGDTWTVALKGLGGARGAIHQRQEHEVEVPAGTATDSLPEGPVRDLLERLRGDQPLADLLALRQHRTLRDVRSDARHVAVLSLDRVEIEAGRPHLVHEMEIELTPSGGIDDLHLLGKLLRPYGLKAQPLSKFERALRLLDALQRDADALEETDAAAGPANHGEGAEAAGADPDATGPAAGTAGEATGAADPPPDPPQPARKVHKKHSCVRADEPMSEAGRKILAFHCERMLAHEAGTRAGDDIEELHQMRVATRRQRAALRIVTPYLRRKSTRPVRDGLRALGQRLGAVRDLDVLLATAEQYRTQRSAEEAGELRLLLDAWTRRREAARRQLLSHLDGAHYAAFKDGYADFLAADGAGTRAATAADRPLPHLVAHVLPGEIWLRFGALRAFEPSLRWASVATLHALRIEAKRLRYTLEFFHEVLDPRAEEVIEALVELQDQLGELHDADVAIGLVREFLAGSEASAHPPAAAAAGRYLEARAARIIELRRSVTRPWRTVIGKRCRHSLARVVGAL